MLAYIMLAYIMLAYIMLAYIMLAYIMFQAALVYNEIMKKKLQYTCKPQHVVVSCRTIEVPVCVV